VFVSAANACFAPQTRAGHREWKILASPFYKRRIKRIFPGLLLMLVTVIALGSVFLLPGDYATAAQSALYAVGSLSNIFFVANTGYFDAASETMPLLQLVAGGGRAILFRLAHITVPPRKVHREQPSAPRCCLYCDRVLQLRVERISCG
jgi:hypothetical protein